MSACHLSILKELFSRWKGKGDEGMDREEASILLVTATGPTFPSVDPPPSSSAAMDALHAASYGSSTDDEDADEECSQHRPPSPSDDGNAAVAEDSLGGGVSSGLVLDRGGSSNLGAEAGSGDVGDVSVEVSSSLGLEVGGEGGSGSLGVPYTSIDPSLQKEICEETHNRSKAKDEWARKRFDLWRKSNGFDCSVRIEKLDLRDFSGMLEKFLLQVVKLDGESFPGSSLTAMYRCYGRMIRQEQERRVAASGCLEVPFDIFKNSVFKGAQNALAAAMNRSVKASGSKRRLKADVLGVSDEKKVLSDIDFSIFHPRGLQRRFAFYCLSRFPLRGGMELHNVQLVEFLRGSDALGEFLEYNENPSKNHKGNLRGHQQEQARRSVRCREADVLLTYDQLIKHLPNPVTGDINLFSVFLQPIDNPRTSVWYNRNRASAKGLSMLVRTMLDSVGGGQHGRYTSKSLRTTAATDASTAMKLDTAQPVVVNPYDGCGRLRIFTGVLNERIHRTCCKVEGSCSSVKCSDGAAGASNVAVCRAGNVGAGSSGFSCLSGVSHSSGIFSGVSVSGGDVSTGIHVASNRNCICAGVSAPSGRATGILAKPLFNFSDAFSSGAEVTAPKEGTCPSGGDQLKPLVNTSDTFIAGDTVQPKCTKIECSSSSAKCSVGAFGVSNVPVCGTGNILSGISNGGGGVSQSGVSHSSGVSVSGAEASAGVQVASNRSGIFAGVSVPSGAVGSVQVKPFVNISDALSGGEEGVMKSTEESWPDGSSVLGLQKAFGSVPASLMSGGTFKNCVFQFFQGSPGSVHVKPFGNISDSFSGGEEDVVKSIEASWQDGGSALGSHNTFGVVPSSFMRGGTFKNCVFQIFQGYPGTSTCDN